MPQNAIPDQPLFTPPDMERAFAWLTQQRKHYPDHSDIWHLRFHWSREQPSLLSRLNAGTYRLQPLQIIQKAGRDSVAIWSSQDALVINMLTDILTPLLPVHPLCEHVKGHGGGHSSVRRVHVHLQQHHTPFVFRTDIRGYYASINKRRLYDQLTHYVHHPILRNLLWQFLHYSVEEGGNFHTPLKGISRGSSLSPLLAAFHLYELDRYFAKNSKIRYARYMDDFIILAPTRWSLRRAVRNLKKILNDYGFTLHPDKTQLGKTERGFDWMGLWFAAQGVQSFAPRALAKHRLHCRRLYEHIRHLNQHLQEARMAQYRRRCFTALVPMEFRGSGCTLLTTSDHFDNQLIQLAASTDTV